jgi:hypothetical protein
MIGAILWRPNADQEGQRPPLAAVLGREEHRVAAHEGHVRHDEGAGADVLQEIPRRDPIARSEKLDEPPQRDDDHSRERDEPVTRCAPVEGRGNDGEGRDDGRDPRDVAPGEAERTREFEGREADEGRREEHVELFDDDETDEKRSSKRETDENRAKQGATRARVDLVVRRANLGFEVRDH